MEDAILEKYDLFWSKYCTLDEALNPIQFNDYLYLPDRFSECFWILFERLNYTHDYCLTIIIASEMKLQDLHELASRFPDSEEAYYWQHNVDVILKSTVLVVMASFTEWGLKRIIEEMGGKPKNNGKGKSNIDTYLKQIKEDYFHSISFPHEQLTTLHSFRKTRNKFAHGDWNDLEDAFKNMPFRGVFASICHIFITIEDCYWANYLQQVKNE